MNRNEEFKTLLRELDQTPPELEYVVTRAKARAKRRRARRWLGVPAGTLAGAFAAFVLLVNTVPTFALACSRIPVLGELAAAVDWSGSLSAAVEHDYVQTIGQSQSKDGVTVTMEYAIVDQQRVELFFTMEQEDETNPYYVMGVELPENQQEDVFIQVGEHIGETGELNQATLDFATGRQVPGELTLDLFVQPYEAQNDQEDVIQFTFRLQFDPDKMIDGRIYEIGQWLEAEGQRILLDRLEVYPTHARLILQDDPDNDLLLTDLNFYLEDELGQRYECEGSYGRNDGTNFAFERHVASPWFSEGERLTLYVTAMAWLDGDNCQVTVDLTQGTAQNLPEGVTLEEVRRVENDGYIELYFRVANFGGDFLSTFDGSYTDPEGGIHYSDRFGLSPDSEDETYLEIYYLKDDYPYDSVILTLFRTQWGALEEPIAVEIK